MAKKSLEKLLTEAQKAYQKRDKRKGARLVDEILRRDVNYLGAWELLYRLYSGSQSFEEFQRAFVLKYYPDKLSLFQPKPAEGTSLSGGDRTPTLETPDQPRPPASAPEKKPSFLRRLFGQTKEPTPTLGSSALSSPALTPPETVSQPAIISNQARQRVETPAAPEAPLRQSASAPNPQAPRIEASPDEAQVVSLPPTEPLLAESAATPTPVPAEIPAASNKTTLSEKVRVLLVDDISQTRETIAHTLRFQEDIEVIGTASNGLQAIQLARELRPDVILMDVNMPDMDGIAATAIIKRDLPATEVVILTVQDDIDYMRRAMLAGARDFLSKPPMIDDLVQSVLKAGELAHRQRVKLPRVPLARSAPVHAPGGKIITVYSPRGGSGCTFIAANLAVALQSEGTPTVVVDGDLLFGDIPVLFDTVSQLSILDLAPRVEELDPEMVNEVLVSHSSGVKVLHPPRPERAELIAGPHFSQLLTYLSTLFTYVIVDTAHRLNEVSMAAWEASDLVLLVSTLDIPSIARARKILEMAPVLNLNLQHVSLVVNQFDPRVGIPPGKLPQAFGQEPAAIIPLALVQVIESVNRGAPLLLKKANTTQPINQAILKMAEMVRRRLAELEKLAEQSA